MMTDQYSIFEAMHNHRGIFHNVYPKPTAPPSVTEMMCRSSNADEDDLRHLEQLSAGLTADALANIAGSLARIADELHTLNQHGVQVTKPTQFYRPKRGES